MNDTMINDTMTKERLIEQSLAKRSWVVSCVDEVKAQHLSKHYGLSPMLARLVLERDIPEKELPFFLKPRLRDLLPDPSLMADMDKAVSHIAKAVRADEPIAIFGDYDVDGVSSVALLKNYFDRLGVQTQTHLPDRMLDGYGLNIKVLEQIKQSGGRLVITLDCGSKDIEALAYAQQQALEIVILDHHPTETRPTVNAFVNPNGPADQSGLGSLTAAGVGFMFLVALNRALRATHQRLPNLMCYLDLVALATVCDVAPLTGLNRAFVHHGLELLARKNRIGLSLLGELAGISTQPNVESFSFTLGPRINAAGRIGQADSALALLTSNDADEAYRLATQLNTLNRQRQAIEKTVLSEAIARIEAQLAQAPLGEAIVIAGKNWHIGVIGIIAARLRDLYERPAAVIAINGKQAIGSARSYGTTDISLAIHAAADLLIRGGGHKQAAGFTIAPEQIPAFTQSFIETCAAQKTNQSIAGIIDMVLDFSAANHILYNELQLLAPFGKGNRQPSLLFTNGRLMGARVSARGHLRCRFQPAGGGTAIDVVGFHQANTALGRALRASVGQVFHIVGGLRPAWLRPGQVEIALEDALLAQANSPQMSKVA